MARRVIGSWALPLVLLLILSGWWIAHLVPPARWWIEVDDVVVFDAEVGQDIIVTADRDIHRTFHADWHVLVRTAQNGTWELVCLARGSAEYHPDLTLPDPMTLDWWTNGQCPTLDEGIYQISTIWVIDTWLLGDRRLSTDSNVFEVEGR